LSISALQAAASTSTAAHTTCPLLPKDVAAHLPIQPPGTTPGVAGSSSSGSGRGVAAGQVPHITPGVTAADLAGDTWWRHVPAEWRRKASSRGQQDYLYTPSWEELQPGHEQYTLATALWWYRSLQGEPILVRGARVSDQWVTGVTSVPDNSLSSCSAGGA
jgi:hypothetical protein